MKIIKQFRNIADVNSELHSITNILSKVILMT